MIAGGGPEGTMARRRVPPLEADAVADAVAALGVAAGAPNTDEEEPAARSNPSATRREKPARRTKP
jgi:hypothetical protein